MNLTLGIDIDSYALHVCGLPDDGGPPVTAHATLRRKGDDEHRAIQQVAAALGNAARDIRALLDGDVKCRDVWIERGFGASRRADFVLGAIFGATIVACGHILPGAAARPMLAADWKREVTGTVGITTKTGGRGNGNVTKPVANDACLRIWRERWPLSIVPTDPNLLDAFGVAYAAIHR